MLTEGADDARQGVIDRRSRRGARDRVADARRSTRRGSATSTGAPYDRAYDPTGVAAPARRDRRLPDRRPGLAGVAVPTLVVHGRDRPDR